MEENIEQLKRRFEYIRLSEPERDRVRAVLSEYMAYRPAERVVEPAPVGYTWFAVHRFAAVVAVALIVVLLGGTVSYAAEGALPGDVLYPVKIAVNEPLRDTLARTPEGKALLEVEKVQRRLAEAETLALAGRFDATAREEIEVLVAKHIDAANARAVALAGDDNGGNDVAEILSATLDVHGSILAALEEDFDGEEVGVLLARVGRHERSRLAGRSAHGGTEADTPTAAPAATEDFDGANGGDRVEDSIATDLALEIAETGEELEKLQGDSVVDGRDRVSARDEVERLLNIADEALGEADEALNDGNFESAEERVVFAQRIMRRVSIMLDAFMKLPLDTKLFPVDPYPGPAFEDEMEVPGQGEVEGVSIQDKRDDRRERSSRDEGMEKTVEETIEIEIRGQ